MRRDRLLKLVERRVRKSTALVEYLVGIPIHVDEFVGVQIIEVKIEEVLIVVSLVRHVE